MSAPAPSSAAPKVAIKFGTSSSSQKHTNGFKKPNQARPPSSLGKRQRHHALNPDSESEEEEEGKREVVTSFGANGAESRSKKPTTSKTRDSRPPSSFVIGGHKNKDWRAELRNNSRSNGSEPPNSSAHVDSSEREPADHEKEVKWGLTIPKKNSEEERHTPASPTTDNQDGIVNESNAEARDGDGDSEALDALLGKKPDAASTFTISDTTRPEASRFSEQDSYKKGLEEAAEVSTMEEYDEIPEGEFGAAMLRGMGWKGETRGAKPREPKRRGHLLGLGAKEDEEIKKGELAKKHGYRERPPRLSDYRRDEQKERQRREERHSSSYKSERERERHGSRSDSRRDSDRNRGRDSHRHYHDKYSRR